MGLVHGADASQPASRGLRSRDSERHCLPATRFRESRRPEQAMERARSNRHGMAGVGRGGRAGFLSDPLCTTVPMGKNFGLYRQLQMLGRPRKNLRAIAGRDIPSCCWSGATTPSAGRAASTGSRMPTDTAPDSPMSRRSSTRESGTRSSTTWDRSRCATTCWPGSTNASPAATDDSSSGGLSHSKKESSITQRSSELTTMYSHRSS